jgi:hypothetical protein
VPLGSPPTSSPTNHTQGASRTGAGQPRCQRRRTRIHATTSSGTATTTMMTIGHMGASVVHPARPGTSRSTPRRRLACSASTGGGRLVRQDHAASTTTRTPCSSLDQVCVCGGGCAACVVVRVSSLWSAAQGLTTAAPLAFQGRPRSAGPPRTRADAPCSDRTAHPCGPASRSAVPHGVTARGSSGMSIAAVRWPRSSAARCSTATASRGEGACTPPPGCSRRSSCAA